MALCATWGHPSSATPFRWPAASASAWKLGFPRSLSRTTSARGRGMNLPRRLPPAIPRPQRPGLNFLAVKRRKPATTNDAVRRERPRGAQGVTAPKRLRKSAASRPPRTCYGSTSTLPATPESRSQPGLGDASTTFPGASLPRMSL